MGTPAGARAAQYGAAPCYRPPITGGRRAWRLRLQGKAAIVTGAGRGIGKGIASVFAQEGARVLVVNRSAEAGQATTDEIAAAGGEASFLQADVRNRGDMERMAA